MVAKPKDCDSSISSIAVFARAAASLRYTFRRSLATQNTILKDVVTCNWFWGCKSLFSEMTLRNHLKIIAIAGLVGQFGFASPGIRRLYNPLAAEPSPKSGSWVRAELKTSSANHTRRVLPSRATVIPLAPYVAQSTCRHPSPV